MMLGNAVAASDSSLGVTWKSLVKPPPGAPLISFASAVSVGVETAANCSSADANWGRFLTAGLAAYHSGAGIPGAIIVAIIAGGVTLTIGQIGFATIRSPLIRAAIGLLYAVPAAIAGYNGTLGFAQMGIPSEAWRVAFAVIGAVAVGGTAWARMALFVPPEERRRSEGGPATHRLAGATR